MTAHILVKKLTLLMSIDLEERSLLIYINIHLLLSVRGHNSSRCISGRRFLFTTIQSILADGDHCAGNTYCGRVVVSSQDELDSIFEIAMLHQS